VERRRLGANYAGGVTDEGLGRQKFPGVARFLESASQTNILKMTLEACLAIVALNI